MTILICKIFNGSYHISHITDILIYTGSVADSDQKCMSGSLAGPVPFVIRLQSGLDTDPFGTRLQSGFEPAPIRIRAGSNPDPNLTFWFRIRIGLPNRIQKKSVKWSHQVRFIIHIATGRNGTPVDN